MLDLAAGYGALHFPSAVWAAITVRQRGFPSLCRQCPAVAFFLLATRICRPFRARFCSVCFCVCARPCASFVSPPLLFLLSLQSLPMSAHDTEVVVWFLQPPEHACSYLGLFLASSFYWGSEGDVRHWQRSRAASFKPSGPGCFAVARPRFWLGLAYNDV